MKLTGLAALATLALVGCGGGGNAPEDQVRETARNGYRALTSDHPERACQYMLDRDKCVGAMVLVKGMDVAAMTGVPEDWKTRVDEAKITVEGDRATMSDIDGDSNGSTYVRKDGKWLADNR